MSLPLRSGRAGGAPPPVPARNAPGPTGGLRTAAHRSGAAGADGHPEVGALPPDVAPVPPTAHDGDDREPDPGRPAAVLVGVAREFRASGEDGRRDPRAGRRRPPLR